MSIIIPGIEMPKSCFKCEFRTKIDPDNLLCLISQKTFEDRFFHIEHRDQSCPLVPVPPHGRLIDADALLDAIIAKYIRHERHRELVFAVAQIKQDMADIINELPTIIPESGGNENE